MRMLQISKWSVKNNIKYEKKINAVALSMTGNSCYPCNLYLNVMINNTFLSWPGYCQAISKHI